MTSIIMTSILASRTTSNFGFVRALSLLLEYLGRVSLGVATNYKPDFGSGFLGNISHLEKPLLAFTQHRQSTNSGPP